MENKLENEVGTLIKKFEDPSIAEEVKNVQIQNPLETLGRDMLSFFNKRLEYISKTEEFKEEIKEKLRKMINNDEKITFSQLSNFFINLSQQNSFASEQIVSLLRPPQGSTSNPLYNSLKGEKEKEEILYDSETQRRIDIVAREIEAKLKEEKKQNEEKNI